MKQRLKVGDIVQLKSGGPDMTVNGQAKTIRGTDRPDRVVCIWFVDGKRESAIFTVDMLKVVGND